MLVYALLDPRTSAVRYVGVTRILRLRVQNHESEARVGRVAPWSAKNVWLRELLSAGLKPEAVVLEEVSRACRRAPFFAEQRWIRAFVATGHSLTNTPGGRKGPNHPRRHLEQEAA